MSLRVVALTLSLRTDWTRVQKNISFHLDDFKAVRTLSANIDADGGGVQGLLYVPDLQPNDPCLNQSDPYIPHNVTRKVNLPRGDVSLVALAPWLDPACVQSYLAAARLDPVAAFYFYFPDNSTGQPPPVSNPRWSLNDGGQWKATNRYPVYAIPGATGFQLMQELSFYSGNMTDVPDGSELTEIYDTRDYARLYSKMTLGKR